MRERDYKREYAIRSEDDRNNRQKRRIARNLMIKKLGISAVKNKDIDHKDGNPKNNSPSNLRIMDKSKNRSKK
ncbi:MAG: HNH endonuclease [bacterium]|nr:HNH endonuclease [bacterium]